MDWLIYTLLNLSCRFSGFSPSSFPPQTSPSPTQLSINTPLDENHHSYHLTVVPGIAIGVTALAIIVLAVLVVLIRRKSRELEDSDINDDIAPKAIALPSRKFQDGMLWFLLKHSPLICHSRTMIMKFKIRNPNCICFVLCKLHEGPSCMFRKFSYKETKKATNNFGTVIGQGGFGIVYKAEFQDGLVAAVKRMSKVSEQADEDFCRELELLARLHHRHLVSLRGFCMERRERYQFRFLFFL